MSQGLNRVILLGNLGADPELRSTNGGTSVLNMRLATSETFLDKNKERQERTEWHRISLWGKRAEALGKFLKKGDRLLVEGSIRTSKYTDNDGVEKYSVEIVAQNVVLSGGSGNGNSAGSSDGDGVPDDDIPF